MVRTENQDFFFLDVLHEDNQAICVVCDGMGGARAGNIAARTAVEVFADEVRQRLSANMDMRAVSRLLEDTLEIANHVVYEMSCERAAYNGMGTTLVGAVVIEERAAVINVGDSRAYHIAGGEIIRITRDHSLVEDMLLAGGITAEEARRFPGKNLITRVLGTEPALQGDVYPLRLSKGDCLLFCSDGLTNMLEDHEIYHEFTYGELKDCCDRLISKANARGGHDNITVLILQIN
jgi:protein phosphatase